MILNNQEIENYIVGRIKDRNLKYSDMVRCRVPMEKILSNGRFDQFRPYDNLDIPLRDLFRYWWDNIADHDGFIDDVLDDIYTVFKDRMAPEIEPELVRDDSDAFSVISL